MSDADHELLFGINPAGRMDRRGLSPERIGQLLSDFDQIRELVTECIASPSDCKEALICRQVREVSLPLCELSLARVVEVLNSTTQCADENGMSVSTERLLAYAEVVEDVICYIENLRDGYHDDDGFLESIAEKMSRAGVAPELDSKPCLGRCPDGMMSGVLKDVASSLQEIHAALAQWQQAPASRSRAMEFLRQLHALKGGVLVYGIEALVSSIQQLESYTIAFLKGELKESATLFETLWRYISRSRSAVGLLQNEQVQQFSGGSSQQTITARSIAGGGDTAMRQDGDRLVDSSASEHGAERLPFSHKLPRLQFLVERASVMLGKSVRLMVEGEEQVVSIELMAKLVAPLELLLWNAIDHGIEPREVRVAAGKPADGKIALSLVLNREESLAEISVADDGAGIDEEAVRKKALATGCITQDEVAKQPNIAEMVFYPGLSTAQSISPVSGRGMGLDVVNTEIARLGGRVQVKSMPGKGACFTLSVPL